MFTYIYAIITFFESTYTNELMHDIIELNTHELIKYLLPHYVISSAIFMAID